MISLAKENIPHLKCLKANNMDKLLHTSELKSLDFTSELCKEKRSGATKLLLFLEAMYS